MKMGRAEDAREARSERSPALARWGSIAVLFAVGAALSFIAFSIARHNDDQRVANVLELRVEWRAQDFQRKIAIAANDIEAMAIYLATQGDITAENFNRFAM